MSKTTFPTIHNRQNVKQQITKILWEDMNCIDDSSDLEESWAGEEVMFDRSPSSGRKYIAY